VLLNSVKGREAFDSISDDVVSYPSSIEKAEQGNPQLYVNLSQSVKINMVKRKTFFAKLNRLPYNTFLKKYAWHPSQQTGFRRLALCLRNKFLSKLERFLPSL